VHDSSFVRRVQRVGDLRRDSHGLGQWDGAAADSLRQRAAFDQFEHQRPQRPGILDPVDGSDMGMVQGGEHLRFALEARHALAVSRNVAGRIFSATSRRSRGSCAR
jgi:hypothetical protein